MQRFITLEIEFDRETDGRWIASVERLPGVMAYGSTRAEAAGEAAAIAVRVLDEREVHGEPSA